MQKIIIEIKDNGDSAITYDNGKTIFPICDCSTNNFHISDITDKSCINLISETIYQYASTLKYQLVKQGFANKPLNKPTDGK